MQQPLQFVFVIIVSWRTRLKIIYKKRFHKDPISQSVTISGCAPALITRMMELEHNPDVALLIKEKLKMIFGNVIDYRIAIGINYLKH